MIRLGLTGGIGSGKSTVARMLVERGAALIDADAVSRSVTATGGSAIDAIRSDFGPEFVTAAGALDRERMRHATFGDASVRKRLEAIVHPLVGFESARQEAEAVASNTPCIVFDIPLLVESGHWRAKVDRVLVIDCPAEIQIARVMARSTLDQAAVERIIAAQATRAQRLAAADMVLYNAHDSFDALACELDLLVERFGL